MPKKKVSPSSHPDNRKLAFSRQNVAWFQRQLMVWARQHCRVFPWRKRSASLYEKVISEVLLQRTRAETVAKFFITFMKQFPSWTALSRASEKQLQGYLQPIGLWRRRAASIEKLASEMARRRGRFPRTREEIEGLPGVGQYIANSILVFAHGEAWPLLDMNMTRVLERYFGPRKLADIRYDPYLQALAKAVVSSKDPAIANWAILDLAASVCVMSNPKHDVCPLKSRCKFNSGSW